MTVVRPRAAVRRRRARRRRPRRPGFHEKPRSRALGQRRLLLLRAGRRSTTSRADSVLEREPLERARRRRPAARLPPRGLLGLHGHLQGRRAAQRPVGAARRLAPLEGLRTARRRRPLGLRHRRLRAARLLAGAALLDARRRGRRAARDERPALGAALEGTEARCDGRPRRPARRGPDRAHAGRVRGRHRLPPRRPDDRRHGEPLAASRPSSRTCAARGRARGLPPARRRARRRRLVRQGVRRRATSCPTARTCRCGRATPTTSRRRRPT